MNTRGANGSEVPAQPLRAGAAMATRLKREGHDKRCAERRPEFAIVSTNMSLGSKIGPTPNKQYSRPSRVQF